MIKHGMIIVEYKEPEPLTLDELANIFNVDKQTIVAFAEHEIIRPQGNSPDTWMLDINEIQRLRRALRLQRDLQINLAGIAVLLQVLDTNDALQAELELFHKHFMRRV